MPTAVKTLRELIRRPAERCPEQNAVVDGTCRLDYATLHDRIRRMAKLLHGQGVRKGDRVALLMPPSAAHLVALFGAIELGAIPAALHVRESDRVLLALLEQLSPRAFVYDRAYAARARNLRRKCAYATAGIQSVSTLEAPDTPGERDEPLIPDDLGDHPPDFEAMPIVPRCPRAPPACPRA